MLTILYDARCQLCCDIRTWVEAQPKLEQLEFLPAGSAAARERYPQLESQATLQELTVVDDRHQVYRGPKAFLMVLWALAEYREWAQRLARPGACRYARRLLETLSQNRGRLGPLGKLLRSVA